MPLFKLIMKLFYFFFRSTNMYRFFSLYDSGFFEVDLLLRSKLVFLVLLGFLLSLDFPFLF